MTLLPTITLLLTAFIMFLLARNRPNFGYFWLIAAGGVIFSWVLVIVLRFLVPISPEIQIWTVTEIFRSEFAITWDLFSWRFSLALCTLTLGVILTEVFRAPEGDWPSWSAGILMSGFGLLSILAGNLFTLLLGFAALDLISSLLLVGGDNPDPVRYKMLVGRLVGTGLVILTGLLLLSSYAGQWAFILRAIYFLGIALRLGQPGRGQIKFPRGLGVIFDITPAILALVVLFRFTPMVIADTGFQAAYGLVVLVGGLILGLRWAVNETLEEERALWIMGMASLAVTGIILNQPEVGMVWGLGLIYGGGLLFLFRLLTRWQVALALIGFWAVAALPFSPSWEGQAIFQGPLLPYAYLVIPVHGLLLAGLLRHFLAVKLEETDEERWVLLIFPAGLILILGTFAVEGLLPWHGFDALFQIPWWPGVLASVLGMGGWWLFRRGDIGSWLRMAIKTINDFFYLITRPIIAALKGLAGLMSSLSLILEGRGGILWAFLLIVLILSLISQVDLGGILRGN